MMRKTLFCCTVFLTLAAIACNLPGSPVVTKTPTASAVQPTAMPPTTLEPTPESPTGLPTATPERYIVPDASVEAPPIPIVYYYFASIPGNTFPAGSVAIVPDQLILSPTLSNIPPSPEPAINVEAGLQAMINDPRNGWASDGLTINGVTFNEGHVTVDLQGDISGVGDAVLIAARMQFLMSVFAADQAVQSAAVTLNGESIGNLGISHESEAKPADYVYTREEIQAFMTENAYP
jgi:hypothetical protein